MVKNRWCAYAYYDNNRILDLCPFASWRMLLHPVHTVCTATAYLRLAVSDMQKIVLHMSCCGIL